VNQLIICGYAVKTLESKETKAKEITVTHNSVFAAHRLQCRMTNRKIDIRHFVCTQESNQAATDAPQRPGFQSRKPVEAAVPTANITALFLNP